MGRRGHSDVTPKPGRALLDLARGRVADANVALTAALATAQAPLERARLAQAKFEVALCGRRSRGRS